MGGWVSVWVWMWVWVWVWVRVRVWVWVWVAPCSFCAPGFARHTARRGLFHHWSQVFQVMEGFMIGSVSGGSGAGFGEDPARVPALPLLFLCRSNVLLALLLSCIVPSLECCRLAS